MAANQSGSLGALPMVRGGLIRCELIGLRPYPRLRTSVHRSPSPGSRRYPGCL